MRFALDFLWSCDSLVQPIILPNKLICFAFLLRYLHTSLVSSDENFALNETE